MFGTLIALFWIFFFIAYIVDEDPKKPERKSDMRDEFLGGDGDPGGW